MTEETTPPVEETPETEETPTEETDAETPPAVPDEDTTETGMPVA